MISDSTSRLETYLILIEMCLFGYLSDSRVGRSRYRVRRRFRFAVRVVTMDSSDYESAAAAFHTPFGMDLLNLSHKAIHQLALAADDEAIHAVADVESGLAKKNTVSGHFMCVSHWSPSLASWHC